MFKKKDSKGEVKEMQAVNPVIILACIILLAAIMTYIIPAGAFERVAIPDTDYEAVVPGSYHTVESNPIKPFNLFMSLTVGLQEAAYIIFFLLILGGVFKIVEATGALHAGINNLIRVTSGKEIVLIPISLVIFSLISALAACCEEYLAFMPLMYMVCMDYGGLPLILCICCRLRRRYDTGILGRSCPDYCGAAYVLRHSVQSCRVGGSRNSHYRLCNVVRIQD